MAINETESIFDRERRKLKKASSRDKKARLDSTTKKHAAKKAKGKPVGAAGRANPENQSSWDAAY